MVESTVHDADQMADPSARIKYIHQFGMVCIYFHLPIDEFLLGASMTKSVQHFPHSCGCARPILLLCICTLSILLSSSVHAQNSLSLTEAFSIAKTLRAELRVAAARVDAASQRPAIVSALDDPIIAPSIDHKPVDPMMRTEDRKSVV